MEYNDDDVFDSEDLEKFKEEFTNYKNGMFDITEELRNAFELFDYIDKQLKKGKLLIEIPEKYIVDKNVKIYSTHFGNIISN